MALNQHTDVDFQTGWGHRPLNYWGDGDLPAPYAEGDTLWLPPKNEDCERLEGLGSGFFVVTTVFSVDEGDAWYCRVDNAAHEGSDRLHVSYPERCVNFRKRVNFMSPFDLVETADPDGLERRDRMIEQGWTPPV